MTVFILSVSRHFCNGNRDFTIKGIEPVTACVTRRLEEEVGLPDCLRSPYVEPAYDLRKIKHVAFARTLDFRQDNFFSIVTLMPNIGIDDVVLMANHAREHKKEIHEIITISTPNEIYCPVCETEELLLGIFDNEESLLEELHRLLRSYDLIALMSDSDILREYSVCEINRQYLSR